MHSALLVITDINLSICLKFERGSPRSRALNGTKINDLIDPELTLNGNYALCYITHMFFRANH